MRLALCAVALAFPIGMASAEPARFSPDGCEHAVHFPAPPRIEASEPWNGRTTTVATLATDSYVLQASCTTGYPEGALAGLDDEQIRAFVAALAARTGLTDVTIGLSRSPRGRIVDVQGQLPAKAGAKRFSSRILYGRTSRMILDMTAAAAFDLDRYLAASKDAER